MEENRFYLSNSMMKDWESGMCPLVFKAKHIDKTIEFEQSEPMLLGSIFESYAIGAGVGGKFTEFTEKLKKSVYYDRIIQQANDCKTYLRKLGGKVLSVQEYIYTEITDNDGQVIYICGGLDIRYGFPGNEDDNIIIDLKFTGDNDNDYGKYQFGNPDKIDCQQVIHYSILHKAKYGSLPRTQYWVFDKSAAMKQDIIEVNISEWTIEDHIEKVSRIYNEIMICISLDEWIPKNTFSNCRNCPVKCDWERVIPDITLIER